MARQDTIDESGEGDHSSHSSRGHFRSEQRHSLERQPTERDRLLDSATVQREREQFERSLSFERERQLELASVGATTSETYDNGLREQSSTLAQRDLIATVLDMKIDSRLEMQRMSKRIGRLEDLLTELVKRLSHDSSEMSTPADENVPTITTTLVTHAPSSSTSPVQQTAGTSILITQTTAQPSSPSISTTPVMTASTSSHLTGPGPSTGLGPIILRKRRSKSRKAPAPPKVTSPEETRLLDAEVPTSTSASTSASTPRKRDYL